MISGCLNTFLYRESAKLSALRAKNVLTYQRALRFYMIASQRALRAYMLMCQRALRAHVPTCPARLHASASCVLTCSRAILLVLMPLFSVSLPLLLKLNTLLVMFKSLITVFPRKVNSYIKQVC